MSRDSQSELPTHRIEGDGNADKVSPETLKQSADHHQDKHVEKDERKNEDSRLAEVVFRDLKSQLVKKHLLIVEDCPDQQRLLANILMSCGASVHLECNGEAAVQTVKRARRRGKPFDAIIMDLYFWEFFDGIDATRKIIAQDPDALIVAVTAHGSPEVEHEWKQAGCKAYLEKPIMAIPLLEALTQIDRKTHDVTIDDGDELASEDELREVPGLLKIE